MSCVCMHVKNTECNKHGNNIERSKEKYKGNVVRYSCLNFVSLHYMDRKKEKKKERIKKKRKKKMNIYIYKENEEI